MKSHYPRNNEIQRTMIFFVFWISFFTAMYFLAGCNTEARKLQKTQEYLFKHPDYSAGYCAEQFPLIPGGIDSSNYLAALKEIDSLLGIADSASPENDRIKDSLKSIIKNMIDNGWNEISADTNCSAVYKYASTLLKENEILKNNQLILKAKIKAIPPIHDTLRDNARENELLGMLDKAVGHASVLQAKLDSMTAQKDEWQGKAKKRWLWIALLIGGFAAVSAFKLFAKFKKP